MTIEVDTNGVANFAADTTKERRERFYARLERNEDYQVQGTLCQLTSDGDVAGFCCLGVATDQAIREGLALRIDSDRWVRIYGTELQEDTLPAPVMAFYGFDRPNPKLDIPEDLQEMYDTDSQEMASSLNDDFGMSFPEIARCFRETYS